mgnify:CR=1 FL=1
MAEKKILSKKEISSVLELLEQTYPDAGCALHYGTPFQLLVAVVLSAQTTDKKVNQVTGDLFRLYPTAEKMAQIPESELQERIKIIGMYRQKSKNVIALSRILVEKYGGEVPETIEELTSLAGVGRKTANVIRGNIYHEPSIVVDTHVKRISNKLGIAKGDDPVKLEFALMKALPKEHWIRYNIQIIQLGREICKAPTPKCADCFLKEVCPSCGISTKKKASGKGGK